MSEVQDGPIDLVRYRQAPLKIMHLLKQPTEHNPSLPELFRELVAEGKWFPLILRVAQRSYCLLNAPSPWKQVAELPRETLAESLLCSAVVNLANDEFQRSTPINKMMEWARSKKDRWHGQVRTYEPDVVVCGGTCDAAWTALGKPEWVKLSTGMECFHDPEIPSCLYVEMPHPSAQYPVKLVYTFLAAGVPEILAQCGKQARRS